MKQNHVLLYPCNIVGYIRFIMLIMAVLLVGFYDRMGWIVGWNLRLGVAVWLFVCLIILDLIDGYLARKLGHTSQFGGLFELTLDLLTHTFVWTLSGLAIAPIIIAFEWVLGLYVAAFSLRPNQSWQKLLVEEGPWLIRLYWRPMPVNWLNDYSNLGHFIFPISLFLFGSLNWLGYLSLPGLIVYEIVTGYMLYTFMKILIQEHQTASSSS